MHLLLRATEFAGVEAVKLLLEYGAHVSYVDHAAVRCAAVYGNMEVLKFLIANGGDITIGSELSLIHAAENGHYDIVKLLIDSDADVTADNNAAVRSAAENRHLWVVKLLVDHGADYSMVDLPMIFQELEDTVFRQQLSDDTLDDYNIDKLSNAECESGGTSAVVLDEGMNMLLLR
jgi:ankyrin repeat protein